MNFSKLRRLSDALKEGVCSPPLLITMNDTEKIREILKDHTLDDERRFAEIQKQLDRMEATLNQIKDIYDGFSFVGRTIIKTGALAAAIAAIGVILIKGVHWIRQ